MNTELEQLRYELNTLKTDNVQMQAQFRATQRRMRLQAGLAFCGLLAAIFLSPGNRAAIAQGYGVTLASLNTRLMAVENKTRFQSADVTAQTTTFSACNVLVQNGLGATNGNPADPIFGPAAVNGLGNLIVGYNGSRLPFDPDVRTGSHNLIVGDRQNYSSYGGLVAGNFNTISHIYCSIGGGSSNTASGPYSSVSGGSDNTASGNTASITGGVRNIASGVVSSVSGGRFNTASEYYSSVSGGFRVTQSNADGWSAGGSGGAGAYHSP